MLRLPFLEHPSGDVERGPPGRVPGATGAFEQVEPLVLDTDDGLAIAREHPVDFQTSESVEELVLPRRTRGYNAAVRSQVQGMTQRIERPPSPHGGLDA
jgi:hypothetical protein